MTEPQSPPKALCSEATAPGEAGVVMLRCAGVAIAAEAAAVRSSLASLSAHPHTIQLDAGAIAISAKATVSPFTALTPDAIVFGRDGEWLVFTDSGRTRVSVWRGAVTMRLRADETEKVLQAGDVETEALDSARVERLRRALGA